jgi:two-component system, OmpR family, phosphate regulon sensor histidine kinase PhoR
LKLPGAMTPAAWQMISRLGLTLLAALVLGFATGYIALAFAITFGIYAAVQVWNLVRLERWLRRRRIENPPDFSSLWGEVVAIVSRIYRRKQFHRARVTALLREFRRLTTAMPEGAVLLGPEHEILWFNHRAAQWLGLRRKRDFGIRVENLVRHPDFVEYLHSDEPGEGVVVQDASDINRWFSFHVVRTGMAERQLLMVRDVSREQQLQSMRRDFVANASHELRSPLTVITGYLDALADDQKLDATWSPPILEMRRQAERMSTIIRDLLELSKLESGERTLDEEPIDVPGMLALLRKETLALEHRPHEVRLTLDSKEWLKGVENEVHSIVSNLVSNAVKYTPPQGEIELRWWVDEDGGHIAVRDTGVGIAAEHIPRLTERFYRVDSGRSRDLGGSGLGLAIVRHALQRHEGTLTIDSVEGRGSTFTCHFPPGRLVQPPAEYLRSLAKA